MVRLVFLGQQNGPEILDKYVGGSEQKIRDLFAEAEQEQLEMGDNSMLHIVIMDEMDAICKQRGTVKDGTGVSDSVVNQLLSKIDGVDSLNNILLIGMTNRKDMIDDALLRPGRLEGESSKNVSQEVILFAYSLPILDSRNNSIEFKSFLPHSPRGNRFARSQRPYPNSEHSYTQHA